MHWQFVLLGFFFQLWITPTYGVRYVFGYPQPQTQFLDWYEQYGYVFATALKHNCTQQYQNYLYGVGTTVDIKIMGFEEPVARYGPGTNITIDFQSGADQPSSITAPVITCIFNYTSDYIKSAMSSAQVLLGLTPTIVALLGPSPMELSLLTVIARRPGLAILLALACPSVYLSRAFDSTSPLEILKERPGRLQQWRPKGWQRSALVVFQYMIALGTLANIAVLYYQLGVRTICMFWPNGTVAPLVWGMLVLPIHIAATIVFRLQARRVYSDETSLHALQGNSFEQWMKDSKKRVLELRKTELVPSATQKNVFVIVFSETRLLICLNWLLTPGIIIHIIFGTLVLSSLTFIGPRDALEVIGRFMISVLVCRAILMYEIAGVRDRYNSPDGGLVPILPFQEPDELISEGDDASKMKHERVVEIVRPSEAVSYHQDVRVLPLHVVDSDYSSVASRRE
ncbi:hypothetical protein F5B21DRAFT_472040 [Xylaria acuta]|nr:hypothetical protein F5B21DRAFT_472040 [Xylaria acuta]